MPPRPGSRHSFTVGLRDDEGRLYLSERVPFGYRDFPDSRVHIVSEADSLFTLAGRYFEPLPRACGLWWVIADFQPDPIFDPTLALDVGRRMVIPSVRVVTDVILADSRRSEAA